MRTDVMIRFLGAVAVLALVSCSGGGGGGNENSGPFPGGFLGLADTQQNVTQCGECHPSEQQHWGQTLHAHAFQTLADIGQEGPDKSCAPCHNLTGKGNSVTDPTAGFVGTPVAALHNVQCESCHGPGANHVADVKQHPDAAEAVSLDTGCGECHQGAHTPFVEEWMQSAHARSLTAGQNFGENVATNPDCAYCHVAQSFIRFIDSGGTELILTQNPQPITCVACHDPHGNGNDKQIRVLPGVKLVCGQCHQQGPTTINNAPHHLQYDMLIGQAGFKFPGEDFPGAATHGNTDINPDLCITCHVVKVPFQNAPVPIPAEVGHTFTPIPIIDEATGERNFDNCKDCHSDPASILAAQQQNVTNLENQLQAALDAVPESQRESDTYKGALFNLETVQNDGSTGVHNPRLSVRLLEVSIEKLGTL